MTMLYRQYRPQTFKEIIGQEHVVSAIKRALTGDKLPHAWLFAGTRGSGKTTIARLLAASINCLDLKDGESCKRCPACIHISEQSALDIIEIDAASNRGIDEIRALKEGVSALPAFLSRKVYIIDEVHMLTKEAFNALLKTLEEPPKHAFFVLATTDYSKIPQTITSRCLIFRFKEASTEDICRLIEKVAKQEKMAITAEAINLIAVHAQGSFRDALSLLDQFRTIKEKIDEDSARQIIGLAPKMIVDQSLEYLSLKDLKNLRRLLSQAHGQGLSLVSLLRDLANELRSEVMNLDKPIDQSRLGLFLSLINLLNTARQSADDYPVSPSSKSTSAPNHDKAKKNENQAQPITDHQDNSELADDSSDTAVLIGDSDRQNLWSELLALIKDKNYALYATMCLAHVEKMTDKQLHISVPFKFYLDRLSESKNRQIIERCLDKIFNREVHLKVSLAKVESVVSGDDDVTAAVIDVFELEGI